MCIKLPCADSHLVWIVDKGAAGATVTFAKAVVVNAILLGLFLLMSLPNDGEAPLDCAACFRKHRQITDKSTTSSFSLVR